MKEIKSIPRRFMEFFGGIWQTICLMIALLLIWYLAGLSLKYSLPVIVFFWAISEFSGTPKNRKLLGNILQVLVLVAFIGSLVVAYFPRINEKFIVMRAVIDQTVSKKMGDGIEVSAKDRWKVKRDVASKDFFPYYDSLLSEGKTQEAADTLAKFQRAWDMDELVKSENRGKEKPLSNFVDNMIGHRDAKIISDSVIALRPGRYSFKLEPGMTTKWMKLPYGEGVLNYFISSPNYDYQFIIAGKKNIYKGGKNASVPLEVGLPFQIQALGDETITIVIARV